MISPARTSKKLAQFLRQEQGDKIEQRSKGAAADGWPIEAWFPPGGDFDVMQKRRVIIPFASVCIPAAQARSRFLLVRFAHVSE
jgi:hypothetical protein